MKINGTINLFLSQIYLFNNINQKKYYVLKIQRIFNFGYNLLVHFLC